YLNQPELTAEHFIIDPFNENERLYRTGDLGRWRADGNIEFTGRKDDQLKIRGYRIETGEIESVLQQHPAITAAAVVAIEKENNEKELVAYIVTDQLLPVSTIRLYLNERLPVYMIPGYYVPLQALPLTTNGKVDRKQLLDPKLLDNKLRTEYVAPRNETEKKLVLLWQELLEQETIGFRDNFFDLGGNSIKAANLIGRTKTGFGVQLSFRNIFKEPTIENLAADIDFILDQQQLKKNRDKLVRIEI
ncbi:MAG TPA: phosphopantetheine-binding protein, partial [Niastella sp.]